MGRVDLGMVRQREEPPEAPMERPGARVGRPGQVGPPDGADEERVARQHEPRLRPARLVGNNETEALGRMAGRMEHADHNVPADELLPVGERREGKRHVRGLVQAVLSARAGGEGAAPDPWSAWMWLSTTRVIFVPLRVANSR